MDTEFNGMYNLHHRHHREYYDLSPPSSHFFTCPVD